MCKVGVLFLKTYPNYRGHFVRYLRRSLMNVLPLHLFCLHFVGVEVSALMRNGLRAEVRLYGHWDVLLFEGGMSVIVVNTSQSIRNFLNCWGVISKWIWGSLADGALAYIVWVEGSLACLRIARTSPIVVIPNSFSMARSIIWRFSFVSFFLANVAAQFLAESTEMPALMKKIFTL